MDSSVWIVYYEPLKGRVGQPTSLIAVVASKEAAERVADEVKRYEADQGWSSLGVALREVTLGKNYLLAGHNGPLLLD